eukprot:450851-Prorocentrum_minimum.AAC.1
MEGRFSRTSAMPAAEVRRENKFGTEYCREVMSMRRYWPLSNTSATCGVRRKRRRSTQTERV